MMETSPFCPYTVKVRHLYLDVFPRVLCKLLLQEMEKQKVDSLVEFIQIHREDLFHLRGKHCCCGNNKQRNAILNNDQWNILFTTCTTPIQSPHNPYKSDCFHSYKANRWLTLKNDVLDFSLVCILLRNTCDSKYKTTIETAQSSRNEVIHYGKSRMIKEDFELLWRKAMTILSQVALFVSKELEKEVTREAINIYNYSEKLDRYIENTRLEIKAHEIENMFSPVEVLECVVSTLEQRGIAIVVGYPGSGKSFIGKEVIRIMLSKQRVVLQMEKVELWRELVNPTQGYCVFIDDFLGAFNITETEVDKLKGYFNTIFACVKNTTCNTRVILTVRKSIYERWREKLEETSKLFDPEVIIDLTEEKHRLSVEERKAMLEKHLQKNGIEIVRTKTEVAKSGCLSIDQFTVNDISKKNAYNFPLLCFLFTKNENLMCLGQTFFEKPRNILMRTIDGLRKTENVKENWAYAVLSYCAILGDKVNPRKLDTDLFTSICNSFELPKSVGRPQRKAFDAIERLKDEYLKEIVRDTYEFIHQSFLEATILSYGEVCPDLVVERCSKDILFDLIRTNHYEEREGEFVLKLDEQYFDKLIDRFMAEIKSSQDSIPNVLLHSVMEDEKFSDQFFNHLKSCVATESIPSEVVHFLLTEASRLGHLAGVKACFSPHFPQTVLEKALNLASYNNHAEVVVLLAMGSGVKLDPHFLQACSFGCEKVVSVMLKNELIRETDVIEEGIFRSAKADHTSISRILIKEYKCMWSNSEKFSKTMLRILKDGIEAEKGNTAREIIFKENLIFEDEDLQSLVMEACYSKQLDLARDLVCEYMHIDRPRAVYNLQSFIRRLLGCDRLCIEMVFEMKEHLFLQQFFSKDNIIFILTSTGSGSYVVEKAFEHFPEIVGSVCSSPDLVPHLLWIGCHSVVSQLCQANSELIKSLHEHIKVAGKYSFLEFAVYCGFRDFPIILQDSVYDRQSLLFHSVQGYLNKGRIIHVDHEIEFGYKSTLDAVNFFDKNSRQEGYLICIEKLYNSDALKVNVDSQILKTVTKILYEQFKPNTIDFVTGEAIKMTPYLLKESSAKMKVLQLLSKILLENLHLSKIQQMIDSVKELYE